MDNLIFITAQAISVLTTIFAVLSMQFKSMKPILVCQLACNLLCAATYLLLGGASGAIICLIAIFQCIAIYICNAKGVPLHLSVILGFIALYVLASALSFSSVADVFSAMGAVFFAIGMTQKKPSAARLWYVANPICWIIYDLFTLAYGNVITHGIILLSTLLAILRLDLPEYKARLQKKQ